MLIESAVSGREIECAVLGNEDAIASGCGEIVVRSGFYSYDSKYIDDTAAEVVVPANISVEASERIRALAVEAFQVLGCSGLARVDVFLTDSGEVLINEINSLPGFTRISMYPKLWQATGMTYSELVTRLIELALEKHQVRQGLKISRIATSLIKKGLPTGKPFLIPAYDSIPQRFPLTPRIGPACQRRFALRILDPNNRLGAAGHVDLAHAVAFVFQRLNQRRAELPLFQFGRAVAAAEVGQVDGGLRHRGSSRAGRWWIWPRIR